MNYTKKMVGVIGPSSSVCTYEMYRFSVELVACIIDGGYTLVCGGMCGVMEGVCRGARNSSAYQFGVTVGILPSINKKDANEFCDIVIPTGINFARNQIIVLTADILIAISGGAGTLSEIAYSWQYGKKVICYTGFSGWANNLAGKDLDSRRRDLLISAGNIDEIMSKISETLK